MKRYLLVGFLFLVSAGLTSLALPGQVPASDKPGNGNSFAIAIVNGGIEKGDVVGTQLYTDLVERFAQQKEAPVFTDKLDPQHQGIEVYMLSLRVDDTTSDVAVSVTWRSVGNPYPAALATVMGRIPKEREPEAVRQLAGLAVIASQQFLADSGREEQ